MFKGKTQEERDAAFLKEVGQHNFKKAQKLLKKGANVLAQDAGGNTAFHKLAGADDYKSAEETDQFVYFLLTQNLDIHARNNQGQPCLHLVAEKEHCGRWYYKTWLDAISIVGDPFFSCKGPEMAGILLKRGARIGDQDGSGRTLLHVAAAKGDEDMVVACLKADPSLIAVQDNEGKYPYQIVTAESSKHYDLLQGLYKKLKDYQAPEVQSESAAPVSDDNWVLLKPDQVAHVSIEKAIGYKLTEIFNFSKRTYARITHNLETKADVSETRGFDEFPDRTLFAKARQELLRLGGEANESSVYGQVLDKQRQPFSKET